MKNKIIMLAIIGLTLTTSIFATPIKENLSTQVLTSFNSKFEGAKEVSWSKTGDYVKASFKMDEQVLFAYFNPTGDLIGVSKNLLSYQLPINLKNELKKISANGWVTELFEFAGETETSYFVTIENGDQKIQLKSDGFAGWSIIKKTKKG